ncbi:MAG: SurA N-terminal domain-containing protein [Chloroflexota bacterium]
MAKKQDKLTGDEQRQSRKEVLLARKQAQQTRQIRLGVAVVGGLLLVVFLAAIINELIIAPNQAVAIVNGEEISLSDWQDRVRFERAQRIILLENQLEAFQGNVGIVQQFAGQTINELLLTEQLGQAALNQMIDEVVIRQAAEARGITVTDAEVDAEIAATFNFLMVAYRHRSPPLRPRSSRRHLSRRCHPPLSPTSYLTNTPFPPPRWGQPRQHLRQRPFRRSVPNRV